VNGVLIEAVRADCMPTHLFLYKTCGYEDIMNILYRLGAPK